MYMYLSLSLSLSRMQESNLQSAGYYAMIAFSSKNYASLVKQSLIAQALFFDSVSSSLFHSSVHTHCFLYFLFPCAHVVQEKFNFCEALYLSFPLQNFKTFLQDNAITNNTSDLK